MEHHEAKARIKEIQEFANFVNNKITELQGMLDDFYEELEDDSEYEDLRNQLEMFALEVVDVNLELE